MFRDFKEIMQDVVPYIGTWIETETAKKNLKKFPVVPYIGTWIETNLALARAAFIFVVPYIGTWIETNRCPALPN